MQVKNVASDEVRRIVDLVSDERYGGNIIVRDSRNSHNSKGLRSRFTIKACDSYGPGARTSWSGRHMPVACWHAHWWVLDRLFREHPDAEVRTSLAVYTARTFHMAAANTAFTNAGSAFAPARLPELCECRDNEWEHPRPIAEAERLARQEYRVVVREVPVPLPAKPLQTLEDRMAREIAEAEATMTWSNSYSWSPDTPHLYEEGLRSGRPTD